MLQWDSAVCVQNGCTYDGASQVYVVAVLATYTCVTEADSCTLGPGFYAYINGTAQPFAICFEEEEIREETAEFAMGEESPVGISRGKRLWHITLEELILPGSPEAMEPKDAFTLRIDRDAGTETFYHCRWTSIRRKMDQSGLRRIRTGIAMDREVT